MNTVNVGVAVLGGLTVLPYDEAAAHQFGLLKAGLQRDGMKLSDLDLQIASIAVQCHAPLVTHNQQHFERVPGLILEDWLAQKIEQREAITGKHRGEQAETG